MNKILTKKLKELGITLNGHTPTIEEIDRFLDVRTIEINALYDLGQMTIEQRTKEITQVSKLADTCKQLVDDELNNLEQNNDPLIHIPNSNNDGHSFVDPDEIDFASLRDDASDNWIDLVSSDHPIENIKDVFDSVIALHPDHKEVYTPILLSTMLLPSAMSTLAPIVLAWGKEGSGKSKLCEFASAVWGIDPLGTSTTYAGLRNIVNGLRWNNPHYCQGEKNYFLIWDDLSANKLNSNPDLYSMLKSGYDRKTSKIILAGKDIGETITFDVFGPRIFSSTYQFFSDQKYREITRRMMVFHQVRSQPKVNSDDINFKGFKSLIKEWWTNRENLNTYSTYKRELAKAVKKYPFVNISLDRSRLFLDPMATGLTCGFFESIEECLAVFDAYEGTSLELFKEHQKPLEQCIVRFLDNHYKNGNKTYISPPTLKMYINEHVKNGTLETFPRHGEVPQIMSKYGWFLNATLGAWQHE